MPDVAVSVEAEAIPGWFNHGQQILSLLDHYQPKVCVELGTWMGASAIPVARSIRRWGGTLTCVDTWNGTVDGTELYRAPWMLASCARNLTEAGVNATVRLIPATTLDAVACWSEPIDYLYVDADHSYEAVLADLYAWAPLVRKGGLILGDDYGHRHFPGVARAWDEYTEQRGLTLTRYQSIPPDPDGIQLVYCTKE